jgi:hypothetical protein
MTCIDFNLDLCYSDFEFHLGVNHEPGTNCILADHGLLSTNVISSHAPIAIEATIASERLPVLISFIV